MSNLGNKEIMAKNIRHYMELNNKTRSGCPGFETLEAQYLQAAKTSAD